MKEKAFYILARLPIASLMVTVCLLPLIFTTTTTDLYELPKTTFLVSFLIIFIIGFLIISGLQGSIRLLFTPVTYLLLALVVWTLLSSLFSVDQATSFSSWLTNFPGSFLSIILFTLFFMALSSLMRKPPTIKKVLIVINISTTIVATLGILSAFKINLIPIQEAQNQFFSPAGPNSVLSGSVVLLGFLAGLGLLWQTFRKNKIANITYLSGTLIITLFYLLLLSSVVLYTLLAIGTVLFLVLVRRFDHTVLLALGSVFFISLLLLIMRLLIFADTRVPALATLPVKEATGITTQAIKNFPVFGSGPATFDHDFRAFKSIGFNHLPIFKVNFETSNFFSLDLIATTGIIGFLLFLGVFITTLALLLRVYFETSSKDPLKPLLALLLSLGTVSTLMVLLLPTNITLFFFIFTLMGLINALLKSSFTRGFNEIRLSFKDIGWLLTLIIFILAISVLNTVYRLTFENYLSKQASDPSVTPGQAYNLLLRAVRMDKSADYLHRQFSLTNLALASSVVKNDQLTSDQKVQQAKDLAGQALNEAKAATTVNPLDSRNWKLYASILIQLQPLLANQNNQVTDKLEIAQKLEPNDPDIYVDLGASLGSDKQFPEAYQALNTGLKIKNDYAPLHLQLAETYFSEAGTNKNNRTVLLTKAKGEYEETIRLLGNNIQVESVKKQLNMVNSALNNNR